MPATGSSSSSTSASCTSSMPISSHCFCPCARIPAGLSARSVSPIVSSASSIAGQHAGRGAAAASTSERPAPAAMSRFCSTVSCSKTLAVWNVRPTPSRAIWCTFLPSSSDAGLVHRPGRRDQPGDRVDQRGLAGAVRADEEAQVALEQREVDAADRLEPVEVDGQAADFEVLGAHADVAAGHAAPVRSVMTVHPPSRARAPDRVSVRARVRHRFGAAASVGEQGAQAGQAGGEEADDHDEQQALDVGPCDGKRSENRVCAQATPIAPSTGPSSVARPPSATPIRNAIDGTTPTSAGEMMPTIGHEQRPGDAGEQRRRRRRRPA